MQCVISGPITVGQGEEKAFDIKQQAARCDTVGLTAEAAHEVDGTTNC